MLLPIQLFTLLFFFQPQPSSDFSDASFIDFRIEPSQYSFQVGDEIKAVLINQTWDDLFIVIPNGCGIKPVQKFKDGEWRTVNTGRKGVSCTQSIIYSRVKSNSERAYQFPWERITKNGYELAGRYRFCISITDELKEKSDRLCTNEFKIRD